MISENKLIKIVGNINFTDLDKYLLNRSWTKIQSKRFDISIFYSDLHKIEIICPLNREFADYNELILNAVNKISIVENREIEQIINDLLLPPSDIIRFRVDNRRTEYGLIAIFICLNISIWFLFSIVDLFVYLWDRDTKGLYLITVFFSIIPTLIATFFITDKD